jgi:hypothetical protein
MRVAVCPLFLIPLAKMVIGSDCTSAVGLSGSSNQAAYSCRADNCDTIRSCDAQVIRRGHALPR